MRNLACISNNRFSQGSIPSQCWESSEQYEMGIPYRFVSCLSHTQSNSSAGPFPIDSSTSSICEMLMRPRSNNILPIYLCRPLFDLSAFWMLITSITFSRVMNPLSTALNPKRFARSLVSISPSYHESYRKAWSLVKNANFEAAAATQYESTMPQGIFLCREDPAQLLIDSKNPACSPLVCNP